MRAVVSASARHTIGKGVPRESPRTICDPISTSAHVYCFASNNMQLCVVAFSTVGMAFKSVALCILVLLAVFVKLGGTWLWSSDSKVDGGAINETVYEYPHPTFVKDNISIVTMSIGNNTIIDWIKAHPWIYAVIGGVALIVAVVVVAVICVCSYYCCYRKKRDPLEKGSVQSSKSRPKGGSGRRGQQPQASNRARSKEGQERETASKTVTNFIRRNRDDYITDPDDPPADFEEPDMGSRMQKYWFMLRSKDNKMKLATAAPVSQKCPLVLDEQMLKGVNKLFEALKVHPFLHPFERMDFDYETRQVVIVQPYIQTGSLKDAIYGARPDTDWSRKYSRRKSGLSTEKVRRYGRQILEAILFLYSKGFQNREKDVQLGHVQSGNIFIDKATDTCQLGGYESTILGYKTRLYRLCKDHLEHFDVIMFGHLVFEMSCGYELTQLRPGRAEYDTVKDSNVKKILDCIFTDGFANSIEEIRKDEFFESEKVPELSDLPQIEFSESAKTVITKLQKNKARTQPAGPGPAPTGLMGKIKHGLKKTDKDETKKESPEAAGVSAGAEKKGNTKKTLSNPLKKKSDKPDERQGLISDDHPVPKYSSEK